jgi:hypothetical protein
MTISSSTATHCAGWLIGSRAVAAGLSFQDALRTIAREITLVPNDQNEMEGVKRASHPAEKPLEALTA